jgi:hypothetical protein
MRFAMPAPRSMIMPGEAMRAPDAETLDEAAEEQLWPTE